MANLDLRRYGIVNVEEIIYNPSFDILFAEETNPSLQGYDKGIVTNTGAVAVDTGRFTGRAPKDKYIVKDEITRDTIWWDPDVNHPLTNENWVKLKQLVLNELSNRSKLYVVDAFCGANKDTQVKVRFIMEVAWQAHFVTNMFIRPNEEELANFGEPDFVVFNGSKATNPLWIEEGLHSDVFVCFNLTEREQIIGGTWYGGEMKKGLFSMMNYWMPLKGIASMHSSANVGVDGDVAVFFGLSGTGKTTLSADPKRALIGDDEHGWDDHGVFNYEGGCYAKVISLSRESEPEIWDAIRRDALLENVVVRPDSSIDFNDSSKTENTRVSYPIYHIANIVKPISKAGHASKIIYLSADAYGVLPPVSILDDAQAQYHFLCGYTSKLAGTELGITEPTPSFSPAFGEAFLTLHPTQYSTVLHKKMIKHNCRAYLVNTGWNGTGKRISLKNTRAIIDAIMSGEILKASTSRIPILNLIIPTELPNVDPNILDPRNSYTKADEWETKARKLARKYVDNFVQYTDTKDGEKLIPAGPSPDEMI